MTANTPQTRKAKGRVFQQALRSDIVSTLQINEGDILSTAMGQGGCDLYLSPASRDKFPFGVEAKAQETISLWSWWKQASTNAEKIGLDPLLVIKKNRTAPLAVLEWDTFLELVRRAQLCQ